jgi:hypothetical protein
MSCHQNAEQNHNTVRVNKSFKTVAKLKYLGIMIQTANYTRTFMSNHRNAGQTHNLMTANIFSKNVAKFKYLRMAAKNKNYIHKKIRNRLNSGNYSYHPVQIFCLPISCLKT